MTDKTPGQMPALARVVYKQIKTFDRQQLTDFCADLYKRGYYDGKKEGGPAADLDKIRKAIESTPGIGPKRCEAIMQNIIKTTGESKK